ncbi:hypothetical protein BJ742DRAFT_772057 [Cladochytrium replicatum]|nr:hypothetical protein BJ742DRAFT_772057 [Cladochytrium replicatum]
MDQEAAIWNHKKEFRKYLEMIIKSPADARSKSGTLLWPLVKAVNEEEDPQRQLSDQELVSSAFIFLVAGHEERPVPDADLNLPLNHVCREPGESRHPSSRN